MEDLFTLFILCVLGMAYSSDAFEEMFSQKTQDVIRVLVVVGVLWFLI